MVGTFVEIIAEGELAVIININIINTQTLSFDS
jgi:hypothetical protein